MERQDGITSRIIAATFLTPIAMWPTASTAGAVACVPVNFRPTLVISGPRVRWVAATGSLGTSERIDLGEDLAVQACVPRPPVASTDQAADLAGRVNFQPTAQAKVANGAGGADPGELKVTEVAHSEAAAPAKPAHSATVGPGVWAEAASVEAADAEAGAGGDRSENER